MAVGYVLFISALRVDAKEQVPLLYPLTCQSRKTRFTGAIVPNQWDHQVFLEYSTQNRHPSQIVVVPGKHPATPQPSSSIAPYLSDPLMGTSDDRLHQAAHAAKPSVRS